MDRTVPKTGSEEIELYMRTYYSLLRSTDAIQIETLVESHFTMESSLHVKARSIEPDISALGYSTLRMPDVMPDVNYIVIGQIEKSFVDEGYGDVWRWQRVDAPVRRRRVHFDGKNTLAVFIASRSDIDDLVPMLTAYQIEWNKLHDLLKSEVARLFLSQHKDRRDNLTDSEIELLASALHITADELRKLENIWQPNFIVTLNKIAEKRKNFSLKLLASTQADYRKATAYWWTELDDAAKDAGVTLAERPVYFVSSNTHSIPNLLNGYALRSEDTLVDYMKSGEHREMLAEYEAIKAYERPTSLQNFLYYTLRKYIADGHANVLEKQLEEEQNGGIYRISNKHGFQIAAQIIDLPRLNCDWIDPRLTDDLNPQVIENSDAVIINIDYPLGLAAYEILNRVTERVGRVLGIYVMGKAATLNGRIGDVMIPNVIHDEHSKNTYLFNNCFAARDVTPYMTYGMVLDNQKAISAPGTFLQNSRYMSIFYHEGYTDIEMEGGPYLSAVYEAYRPIRHPQNEIVNLQAVPFDLGFLHYASDTPMSKGENLGARNLGYAGVDPTYASAIAILRRIFELESKRLEKQPSKSNEEIAKNTAYAEG